MICFVSIEHESWLEDPEARAAHLAYCMDVKLKLEEIAGTPCLVQRYQDVNRELLHELGIKALLISGNASDWVHYDPRELTDLYEIIRQAEWPILGFCGGLQLIAMAHGSDSGAHAPPAAGRTGHHDPLWSRLSEGVGLYARRRGRGGPDLRGLGTSPVFLEVHYCEVKAVAARLSDPGLQRRDCPIQTMKQLDQPIYGVQFHPEGYTDYPHDRRNALVNLVYPEGYPQAQPDGRGLTDQLFPDRRPLDLAPARESRAPIRRQDFLDGNQPQPMTYSENQEQCEPRRDRQPEQGA